MSTNLFGNMGNLLKQAQAMQEKMAKIQEQASSKIVSGTSGGGMVTVTVSGALQVVSMKIDPEVMKSGDCELLQDLVLVATNEPINGS